MKHIGSLAGLLLLVPLSAALSAQPGGTHSTSRIDANGDGVIDRAEAAAHPRLKAHFNRLDRNRDGRLSAGERPMRGKRGHGGHQGIEQLDIDSDGRISRDEFDRAHATREARHPAASRHAIDFVAADANRDGHLVRAEVRAYHDRMRPQREAERKARFEQQFAKADLNRDGRLNRIEVDEAMPRLSARFAWLDENRDGYLSRAELQPRPRH